jgi:rhamnogalacturonyl hydrolase YesR
VPGWGIENNIALYEYTGKTQWLARAEEIFDKTLLAMEKKNGAKGHIIKDGNQNSQFMMYMVEPVCRLHHYTGRNDVIGFLQRVLDWQIEKRSGGGYEKGDMYHATVWQDGDYDEKPEEAELDASSAYSIGLLDGYAYLYRVTGKSRYLDIARRLFKESIFYYGCGSTPKKTARTPLGFHYYGSPIKYHAEKMQAVMGRYGQLYMQIEVEK